VLAVERLDGSLDRERPLRGCGGRAGGERALRLGQRGDAGEQRRRREHEERAGAP
jgi:hypothetical protein